MFAKLIILRTDLNTKPSIIITMETENFIRKDEFSRLLLVAKDDRERSILLLLAGAGLRVGELCSVKVEDIDFEKSYLHIPRANTKGKKPRTVALVPEVVDALHTYLADRRAGWLFPSKAGDHIGSRRVQYILDAIGARAGIALHPHLLRHSHAVWALDSGISVYDVQKQLGHSSILTTAICLESAPPHRRDSYLRSNLLSA
jgi:integrase/recombinase XerD